jgi:UDP-N-acetylmuramoyl-tripeptide--D-alanyl-D-alanine ligase
MEMLGSRKGVAKAKGELLEALPADGVGILWAEDDYFDDLRVLCPRVRTFGMSGDADCRVTGYRAINWTTSTARLTLNGQSWDVTLPSIGRHQALNAAAALLAAVEAGVEPSAAARALENAVMPEMRLEAIQANNGTILLDSYNASPDSTVAAIKTLAEAPCTGRRLAVLGEMKELGDAEEAGHRTVGKALSESTIDLALITGGAANWIYDEARERGFPEDRMISLDRLDLERVKTFISEMRSGDALLIKGSRALELESALPKEVRR